MAAFDFPSPPVEDGFEVKNELTGITYKYDAASGSWVVVASNVQDNYYTKPEVDDLLQSVSPDLIWENTNPPLPDTPYKLWYNTDTLELYFYYCDTNGVCAWTPTSVPLTALEVITNELNTTNAMVASVERLASANFSELQQIQSNLGQVTLEEVLTNGNIADHAIELTDGTDDAIIISPETAIVGIASDLETKNPRFRLSHIDDQGHPDSHAQWEIDDKGTRNDLELSGDIEALHVRFDDQETFTLDKTGEAVFAGKVKVQPGVEENEVVTYGQLATVAEELEQLAPSIEHGSWTWTTNQNPGPGQYTTIQEADNDKLAECASTWQECLVDAGTDNIAKAQCQREYDACLEPYKPAPNPDFSKTYQIKFNNQDSQGNDITFDTVEAGQLIDVFNESNDNYLVGEIAVKSDTTFTITRKSSKGFASGLARIKIFTLNDQVEDLTNYVRKTGDTMTGNLQLDKKLNVDGKATFKDAVKVLPNEDSGKYSFTVYGRVDGFHDSALLLATNNDWIRNIDDCVEYFGTSESDESLVTKKYVEEQIKNLTAPKPANYRWKLILRQLQETQTKEKCALITQCSVKEAPIRLSHTDLAT